MSSFIQKLEYKKKMEHKLELLQKTVFELFAAVRSLEDYSFRLSAKLEIDPLDLVKNYDIKKLDNGKIELIRKEEKKEE